MGLFHYVWLSEGQPVAKADQQDFHPKHRAAAAASLASGGVTAFSPG